MGCTWCGCDCGCWPAHCLFVTLLVLFLYPLVLVSLDGVLYGLVLVMFCLVFVLSLFMFLSFCMLGFWVWEFLIEVGRVRSLGEVGELAAYAGVPYLRWTH